MKLRDPRTIQLVIFIAGSLLILLAGVLLAVLSCVPAGATDIEEGHVFSGVETMTFQNGFSPTPDYAGIVMLGISGDSTAITKGDMSWPGDSLIYLGDVGNASHTDRILFRIDLSALPDSAVIVDATLYMLKLHSTMGDAEFPHFGVHRLFRPFDGTASWLRRRTGIADTAWVPAGAITTSSGAVWPSLYGASQYNVRSPRIEFIATATGLPTYGGFSIACGSDSVWSGYSQSTQGDALLAADAVTQARWRVGLAVTECWVPIDITHLVTMWHQGFWANYGAVIAYDTANSGMYDVEFHGHLPAGTRLVPWVVVHYLHCAW